MIIFHTSPIEIVFTFVAFCVVVVSIWALRDAMIDSAVLTAARVNGPRRMISENAMRQEEIRLAIGCVMLLASVLFLFLEPPPPEYTILPQSLAGMIAWIVVGLMLSGSSILDRSVRRRLQKFAPMEVQTEVTTVQARADDKGTAAEVMKVSAKVNEERKPHP